MAESTAHDVVALAANRLSRVFDHKQVFAISNCGDAVVIGSKTKQIDRNDCLWLKTTFLADSSNGSFKLFDIHVVGVGIDIDENRLCTNKRNNFSSRCKRERRNENCMARADAARHQRHLQGVGAVGAGDHMLHAQIFTELLFELSHFRTENVTAFRNNLGNGGIKTVFDTRALRSKINELHVGSNLSGLLRMLSESTTILLFLRAPPCHGWSVQSFAIPVTPLDRNFRQVRVIWND